MSTSRSVLYSEHSGRTWRPRAGELRVYPQITGPGAGDRRNLYVWLPPSYHASQRRYPVLYMHDGQNLFDPDICFAGSWRVDETMAALASEGQEAIVVGIANLGKRRIYEYGPFHDPVYGGGGAEAYLDFLTSTVKPLIDSELRTRPERPATGMIGSSMGGLISIYGLYARPQTFGFAGVLSPSLFFGNSALFDWLRSAPAIQGGRVFISMGTGEGAGKTRFARWRRMRGHLWRNWRLARQLRHKGLREADIERVVVDDAGHTEAAWAALLPQVVRFLWPRGLA